MSSKPAIVIAAYKRVHTLSRLLASVAGADYSNHSDVPLVISIDGIHRPEVVDLASGFLWPHGEKRVIERQAQLGWREHAIACGDLIREYDAIILLEDDLYVSPAFYDYATRAIEFYASDEAVSGVSLYSPEVNENTFFPLPFRPIEDGSDVFFLQKGVPWGWVVTHSQWEKFRAWYHSGKAAISEFHELPSRVISWPETSFSKYFIKYLVEHDRYVVHPRSSLSTNFGDPGIHLPSASRSFQVSLDPAGRSRKFVALADSFAVYDAYHELTPRCLNALCEHLRGYDYAVDLYGTRNVSKGSCEFLLSTRMPRECIRSFGRDLVPMELNVIQNLPGEGVWFARSKSFEPMETKSGDEILRTLSYFYPEIPVDQSTFASLAGLQHECVEKERQIRMLKAAYDSVSQKLSAIVDGRDMRTAIKASWNSIIKAARRSTPWHSEDGM